MVENIVALDGGEKEDGTKKKTKKSKRTSSPPEKLEDGSHEAGERRRSCLLSIAAYLEKHGFSDTLSALRSEARFQLEEGDGLKGQSLDLDDVFGKFVESCKVSTEERSGHQEYKENIHINQKKQDKDSGTCGVNENELNALVVDGNKEGFSEKKRKKSSCPDSLKEGPGEIMHDEPENGEYHIDKSHIDSKSKKKKKAKHELLDEKSENQKSTEASCQSYQLNTNIKDKKKRKRKLASENLDEQNVQFESKQAHIEEMSDDQNPSTEILCQSDQLNDKKKRKRKLASENLDEQNVQFESKQAHIEEKSDDQNPSTEILCQSDQLNDKKKKKRKLASENLDEQNVQTEPKQVHIEEKSDDQKPSTEVLCQSDQLNAIAKDKTKKKHKLASGTLDEHIVEIGSAQAQESVHSEINTEPLAAKNNGEVKPKKSKDKERKINKAVKEVIAQDIKNDIDVKQGDSINKNFNERNNPVSEKTTSRNEKSELNDLYSLSNKKENAHKGSSESKSGNAFQRVKIDKIAYADERLKDNSYWAKRGADGGYGAKAQEILGQVRGRDFRHEKTKKKRGSYRGGLIDLQSHSIKFNYSDDE